MGGVRKSVMTGLAVKVGASVAFLTLGAALGTAAVGLYLFVSVSNRT